jgi:hypothetical protein
VPTSPIHIPVSAGELLDKKTILEIKAARLSDPQQLANVHKELALLTAIAGQLSGDRDALAQLEAQLREINVEIWDCENAVRAFDREGEFGPAFVQTARKTYAANDRRSAVKRRINLLLDSALIEEKSHAR